MATYPAYAGVSVYQPGRTIVAFALRHGYASGDNRQGAPPPGNGRPGLISYVAMFRAIVIVFLLGWSAWFLIDKSPASVGRLPEAQDEILQNFQTAFDILKDGYLKAAWVFIWPAHYLLLSILGGLLMSMGWDSITTMWSRKRLRRLYIPEQRRDEPRNSDGGAPKQVKTDTDDRPE